MRKIIGLLAVLATSTALAQWVRAPDPVDQTNACLRDTGEVFNSDRYDGRSTTTIGCNTLNEVEPWMVALPVEQLLGWLNSFLPEANALTVKMAPDETGERNTNNPNGTGTVQSNCLTSIAGATCGSLGTATCNFDVPDGAASDRQQINSNVNDGWCAIYWTTGSETNLHIEMTALSVAPNSNTGSGTFPMIIANGSSWGVSEPVFSCPRFPHEGEARFREQDAAGSAVPPVDFGIAGTTLPRGLGCEYNASTDQIQAWEHNGTGWCRVGDPKTISGGAGAGTFYGIVSNNSGAPDDYTGDADDIVVNTTLSFSQDASCPGGSSPGTPGGNFSRAAFPGHTGGPDFLVGTGQNSPDPGSSTESWDTWMGINQDIYVAWHSTTVANTWAELQNPCSSYNVCQALRNGEFPNGPNTVVAARVPIVPNSAPWSNRNCANPDLWTEITNGDHDANITATAQGYYDYMTAQGFPHSRFVLSLAWEMNGDWYPHSICDQVAAFKTGWARVVSLWRAVFGSGLVVDFSPARGNRVTSGGSAVHISSWAPAASSWDVISKSWHDGWYSSSTVVDENSWELHHLNNTSNSVVDLNDIDALAAANDRWLATTEWATQFTDCNSTTFRAAQNQTFFIDKSLEWLDQNKARIAWAAYFSPSCTKLHSRPGEQAAINFKAYMSDGIF